MNIHSILAWLYVIITFAVCVLFIIRAIYVVIVIIKAIMADDYGCVKAQALYLAILVAAFLFYAWVAEPGELLVKVLNRIVAI